MLCSWGDCEREATTALMFAGQAGHVHDCGPHTAIVREWSDVVESAPMPCPWACSREPIRVEKPRDLSAGEDPA
jgi:hypothetical protein